MPLCVVKIWKSHRGRVYYAGIINDAYEKVVSTFDMFVLCRMWRTW